ncbi:MAG: response regulator receiver protein [Clostridia bacterium]|jgi:two-component system response regulator YesN|nr:response regulator receiver protein [Clostridia bacterium]
MIVDDERPARELLKMTLDWQSIGFDIVCEASDGEEALKLYKLFRPDLIITDIQMPIMDGLELIQEIRKLDSYQKFIILSCHENFSYAKKALKLGVLDYLIKDALNKDDLYTVLHSISFSQSETVPMVSIPQTMAKDQGKNNTLNSILTDENTVIESTEIFKEYITKTNYDYFCCIIKPEERDFFSSDLLNEVQNHISSVLGCHYGGTICHIKNNLFAVLSYLPVSASEFDMMNKRFEIVKCIRLVFEQIIGSQVSIGISQNSKDLLQIRRVFTQAKQALSYRTFLGTGKILYYDALQNNSRIIQADLLNKRIVSIKSALKDKNLPILKHEISHLYKKELQGMLQYNYLQHINSILFGLLTTSCQEETIDFKTIFDTDTIALTILDKLETLDDMCAWFIIKFTALVSAIEQKECTFYSLRIRRIINYIHKNYNKDISLDNIADEFDIHKVYLARIFKEEAGQSVNEYIRNLRIERAKELLRNTNDRINEIVYKIGFNNPQSFYMLFKKYVGVNPNEFRDNKPSS